MTRFVNQISTVFLLAMTSLLLPAGARAQAESDVRGTIADSAGTGLNGAMVVALAMPDSTLTEFTTTNGEGAFTLRGLATGSYVLQVTLIGYGTVRNDLTVTGADIDAGTINMAIMAVEMDPLVVTLDHVPFLNTRDTLAYNALAFETRPNATVEDLLRRLPGIEVDADGSITAQGEEVQNVLVDGREFFGSDPTIATRSLPADAVETVEVYDKESDTAEFTGIPDGEEERTINLGLRENARSGFFGSGSGGLGADIADQPALAGLSDLGATPVDNRVPYNGSLNINRFSPTTQLAVIAGANNINRPAFGGENRIAFGFSGGEGGRGGGSFGGRQEDGFVESAALGLNFSREFGEDTYFRSSYFYNQSDNLENQTRERQQLFGSEVTSLVDQMSSSQSDDYAHRFNLNSQIEFSEGHQLRLRGNLNARGSTTTRTEFQDTRTVDGRPLNTAATDLFSTADNLGGDARLTWRKRLSENGRSVVAEARANLSDDDRFSDLTSTITGDSVALRGIDQNIFQDQTQTGRQLRHSVRLSLTEPLGERTTLEVYGERSAIDEDQDKSIFDLDTGQPVFNDVLSSAFERTYTYLRGGARFNTNSEKLRFVVGMRVQNSDLNGLVIDRDETIANGYTHLLPNADLRLQLGDSRNLNFRYNTSTREPSMRDLQPFTDNTDPLNVYTGNPDLEPEYTHRFSTDYRFFDQFSFLNIFAYGNVNFTTNNISQARTADAQGLQSFTPVNAGREWAVNGGLNFGRPIRSLGAQINLNYSASYSRGTELINGDENRSKILRNGLNLTLENRRKDLFDVRGGASLSFNNVNYSLNERLNQTYLNSTFFGNGSLYLGSWTLATSMNIRVFDQDVFGPGQNIALWEASISRLFMDDRAEIQLVAFDILNQNQGVRFTNSANYIQEQRIQSLSQYVMLSFVYHLGPRGAEGRGPRGDVRRRR